MKNQIKCIDKTLLVPIIFYIMANVFMLFMNGLWWDDWVYLSPDKGHVRELYQENGGYASLYVYNLFNSVTNWNILPYLYRALSFLTGFFLLIISYFLLNQYSLKKNEIFYILLLVSTSPLFSTKITMVCGLYGCLSLFFYIGCYFFNKYLFERRICYRLLSFILFLVSLFIWYQAILAIPCFVVLSIILLSDKKYNCSIWGNILKYLDFFIIPLFFWIIRSLFLMPQNNHANYYKVSFTSLGNAILPSIQFFIQSIADYFYNIFSLYNSSLYFILFLILGSIVYFIGKSLNNEEVKASRRYSRWIILLPLLISFSAVLPSLLIGRGLPCILSVNSRFQSLYLLPFSVTIYFAINLICSSEKIRRILLSCLLAGSFLSSISILLDYQKSWFKAVEVSRIIAKEEALNTQGNNIIFNDLCRHLNYYPGADWAPYELTGISKMALNGDETHNYINIHEYDKYVNERKAGIEYNVRECANLYQFDYIFSLSDNRVLSSSQIIYLTYLYYVNYDKFKTYLDTFFKYNLIELDSFGFYNQL
ncbi:MULTISPECIES: hypothetical protein [unclassified Bacteroides]|uniref:hypothetical protein n=1 Tax=unclassified Bacteroides TaxID=2646097 RepID=UPI0013EAD163|nr:MULTISPECIES: hypothetical protein [unclassified Bacteroides]QTO24460.1 hypothetical protein G7Y45_11295 [Bacteroides sp. ZJ-18]